MVAMKGAMIMEKGLQLVEKTRPVQLTPRQRQVLMLLRRGLAEKDIANELRISRHTVHAHVKGIYTAFDVSTRAELLSRWCRLDS